MGLWVMAALVRLHAAWRRYERPHLEQTEAYKAAQLLLGVP